MRKVTLAELLRFYNNPAKFLLENRLKIRLEDISVPLEEREPFVVEGLEAYGLNQELLEKRLQGGGIEDFREVTRCRGLLPPVGHGDALFAGAVAQVDLLVGKIKEQIGGSPALESFFFDEAIGAFQLSGKLEGIRQGSKVSYRCAKLKAKDEIRTWIEHLVLCAFAPQGYPRESVLVMKDAVAGFKPVQDPAAILATLLDRYWSGLQLPLRFFPGSSLEFASSGSLDKARKKWESGFKYTGEEEEPHFLLCFEQDADPLNEDFESLARELLDPLVQHRQ